MHKVTARKTNLDFDENKATLVSLEKGAAVDLIQDLVLDLAGLGEGKLVLRLSDGKFLILKVT